MKEILLTVLADLAIAGLTALIAELIQNTRLTFNPFELQTRLWALAIAINATGIHLELHTCQHS